MFKKQTFSVLRQTSPAAAFSDPVWEVSHTLSLGYEAVGYSDSIQANQNPSILRGVAYFYGNVPPNLTTSDLLKDQYGTVLKVQSIQPFQNGLIPHFEINLIDSQWTGS